MMVGRPEKALDVRDPIQAFAQQLRDLRRGCDRMTYAEMASRCNYSAATLSEAARGATMPSWEVTAAYVAACGGDLVRWRSVWEATKMRAAGANGVLGTGADGVGAVAPAPPASSEPAATAPAGDSPAEQRREPALRGWWVWTSAIVATVVIAVVTFVVHGKGRGGGADKSVASLPATSAVLLTPTNRERVGGSDHLTAQFTVTDLPPAHTVWCFVVNDEGRWFPYRAEAAATSGWRCRVGVGPRVLKNELVLGIHVVDASPAATSRINDAIRTSSPEWAGLDGLPAGAHSRAASTITRTH